LARFANGRIRIGIIEREDGMSGLDRCGLTCNGEHAGKHQNQAETFCGKYVLVHGLLYFRTKAPVRQAFYALPLAMMVI
jgi:hypothetical protein